MPMDCMYGYYPSAVNRADAPTRDAEVPGPDVELPSWWEAATSGDFGPMDEWLRQASEIASSDTIRYDVSSLGEKEDVDLRSNRLVRASERFIKKEKKVHGQPHVSQTAVAKPSPSLLCAEALAILQSFSSDQVLWPKGRQVL